MNYIIGILIGVGTVCGTLGVIDGSFPMIALALAIYALTFGLENAIQFYLGSRPKDDDLVEIVYSNDELGYNFRNEITYAHENDSGFDIKYAGNHRVVLDPLERKLLGTGLRVALPPDTELQIRPRSGNALKRGISVLNTPGTIDRGYAGEIGVIIVNLSPERITIEPGEKIAQGVICPVIPGSRVKAIREMSEIVKSINECENGTRSEGGFGSTGN